MSGVPPPRGVCHAPCSGSPEAVCSIRGHSLGGAQPHPVSGARLSGVVPGATLGSPSQLLSGRSDVISESSQHIIAIVLAILGVLVVFNAYHLWHHGQKPGS